MKETAKRISIMIQKAKEDLGIPEKNPLDCVVGFYLFPIQINKKKNNKQKLKM